MPDATDTTHTDDTLQPDASDTATAVATEDAPPSGQDRQQIDVEAEARKRFDSVADRHEPADQDEAKTPDGDTDADDKAGEPGDTNAEAEQSEADDTAQPDEAPEGFDEATAAFLRDGLTEAQIKALYTSDPKGFVSAGQKRAKVQRDVDRMLSQRGQQAQTRDEPGGKDAASKGEGQQKPADKQADDYAKQIARDALKGLIDEAGDDAIVEVGQLAGILENYGQKLAQAVQDQLTGRLTEQMQQTLAQREAEMQQKQQWDAIERELEASRQSYADQYPQLKDDTFYDAVLEHYDVIVRGQNPDNPRYTTVKDAFAAALALAATEGNPAAAVEQIKQNMFRRTQQQKQGQPRARSVRSHEPKPTIEQIARQRFEQIADKHESGLA